MVDNIQDIKGEIQYAEFLRATKVIENAINENVFNEAILDNFLKSPKLNGVFKLIKELSKNFDIKVILEALKVKEIFLFFKKISFSLKKFMFIVKQGYKAYLSVYDIISVYIKKHKITRLTEKVLNDLDKFLTAHPTIKKITGLVVAGMLIYIWFNMSFAGNIKDDFDQSYLFGALLGNYSLSEIFSSPTGIKMLLLFATGVLTGLSFPWPGHSVLQFIYSLFFTVIKEKKPDLINNLKQVRLRL